MNMGSSELDKIEKFIPRQAKVLNFEVRGETIYFEYRFDGKKYRSKLACAKRAINARTRKRLK